MSQTIQRIIELLVERFFPLIGGMFASTVETFHALGLAEQQSQLEEAARRYEAQDKPEIAEALRRRAQELSSDDPAARAVKIAGKISSSRVLSNLEDGSSNDRPRLTANATPKIKRRQTKTSVDSNESRDHS